MYPIYFQMHCICVRAFTEQKSIKVSKVSNEGNK